MWVEIWISWGFVVVYCEIDVLFVHCLGLVVIS